MDNFFVIDNLRELDDSNIEEMNFYVNYVEVDNKVVLEKIVDVLKMFCNEVIISILYSGLLLLNLNVIFGFKE